MKKIIIFSVLIGALFFTLAPTVQAKQELFKLPIPAWFSQAIQPFQNTLKALIGKVDNHEARITELEKKVASLEENINNLEKQLTSHTNLLINPNSGGETIISTEPMGAITPSEPVGIGPTNSTEQLNLNCGSSNCQEQLLIP